MAKTSKKAVPAVPGGTAGPPSSSIDAKIASECNLMLRDWTKGQRAKAKKALQKLCKDSPHSHLPHRYLARVYYHEAAESQDPGGKPSSELRLGLLTSALEAARAATELNPHSLSSAALRATCVVNVLVEESSLFGNKGQNGAAGASSDGLTASRCQRIKQEFKDALAACTQALTSQTPTLIEPVISIADGSSQTTDPCCLRVQDQIQTWCREGRWDRIAQEKRSVLSCMTQVLESCYTLLDSTQIPVDGIVRLLQHILRPQQQELQMWASQLLLGRGMTLEDLQKKFETQAAVAELLKMLRPNGRDLPPLALAPPPAQTRGSTQQGVQQQQQQQQPQQPVQQQQQQQGAQVQPNMQTPGQYQHPHQFESLPNDRAVVSLHQQHRHQHAVRVPRPEPSQCLSVEREWDKDGGTVGSQMPGGAANNNRRRTKKLKNGGSERKKERTRYERYMDVESFWKSTTVEQRRELLRVPMSSLLQAVRQEHGPEAAEEVCEGLVLLREQGNRSARYWACPICEQRFSSRKDYSSHVELLHEELAVLGDKYVSCAKCQMEVVGMYYTSSRVPGYHFCFRCYHNEMRAGSLPEEAGPFEKVIPRTDAKGRAWSDTSDFISTRDSFSSLDEEGYNNSMGGAAPPGVQGGAGAYGQGDGASHHQTPRAVVTSSGGQQHTHQHQHQQHQLHQQAAAAQQQQQPQHLPQNPQQYGGFAAPGAAAPAAPTQPPSQGGPSVPRPSSAAAQQQAPAAPQAPTAAMRPGAPDAAPGRQAGAMQWDRQDESGGGPLPGGAGGPAPGQADDGSNGLWRSWWPRRLMPSWSSSEREKAKQQGKIPGEEGAAPGAGPPGTGVALQAGAGAETARPGAARDGSGQLQPEGQRQQLRRQGSAPGTTDSGGGASEQQQQRPAGQAGEKAPDGQAGRQASPGSAPGGAGPAAAGQGGSQPGGQGAAAAGQQGAAAEAGGGTMPVPGKQGAGRRPVNDATAAGSGGAGGAEDEGGDYGGELHEVIQVVEEVMRRMRDIYGADREVGDMTLGSITQFVHRKLSTMLDEIAPQEEAPVVRQCLDEFMDQPSCVFQKPDVLRAVLGCLPFRDLQMVLAYVVRQHAEALARVEEGASNGSGSSSVDGEDDSECDEEDDEECDDEDDECDEEDEGEEEEEEEEEFAGASLFQVVVQDEGVFHQLIADCWNCDDSDDVSAPPVGTAGNGVGSRGSPGAGEGKRGGGGGAGSGNWLNLSAAQDHQGNGLTMVGGGRGAGAGAASEPFLEVTDWWLEHLALKSKQEEGETQDGQSFGSAELRWLYGKIVLHEADQFMARQRELRAGRDRETVILELYEDLAFAWRSLQATTDKRNRLEELRRNVRAQFTLVKQLEEERNQCTLQQATEFLNAVNNSHYSAQQQPGQQPTYLYLCEQAVDVVRRYPALAQEPSQRYARALLDRELAVLLLSEAMLMADSEEAAREKQAAEEQLKKQRQEAKEVEAEYQRVEAEGPASHRKKDLLDKATKEAEHRERLQDLLSRLTSLNERVVLEESSRHKWAQRSVEAERDLEAVRTALRNHATRKKHLEDVCAQLDCPVPPPMVQQQMQQMQVQQQQQQQQQQAAQQQQVQQGAQQVAPQQQQEAGEVAAGAGAQSGPATPQGVRPGSAPVPQQGEVQQAPAAAATAVTAAVAPGAVVEPGTPTSSAPSDPVPVATPGASAPSQAPPSFLPASAPVTSAPVPAPPTPPPATSPAPAVSAAASAAAADMEWRAQRLECLMYRVLWVSEAVQAFHEQYSPHSGGQHYDLFIKSTNWAKSLADDYDEQIKGWLAELDKLRRKLCEASCVDLGYDLAAFAQEVACRRVEDAARRAREAASLTLLRELEEEEAAKGAASGAKDGKGDGKGEGKGEGAGGGKAGKKNKSKPKVDKQREKKEKEELERTAKLAEDEARRQALEVEKQRLAAARQAREAAIEAELERRRRELEELEATREAEAIRAAQEASLKEQREVVARKEREAAEAKAAAAERAAQERQQQLERQQQEQKAMQQLQLLQQQQQAAVVDRASKGAQPQQQQQQQQPGKLAPGPQAPPPNQAGRQGKAAAAPGAPQPTVPARGPAAPAGAGVAQQAPAGGKAAPGAKSPGPKVVGGHYGEASIPGAPVAQEPDRQKRNARRTPAHENASGQAAGAQHMPGYPVGTEATSGRAPANKQQRGLAQAAGAGMTGSAAVAVGGPPSAMHAPASHHATGAVAPGGKGAKGSPGTGAGPMAGPGMQGMAGPGRQGQQGSPVAAAGAPGMLGGRPGPGAPGPAGTQQGYASPPQHMRQGQAPAPLDLSLAAPPAMSSTLSAPPTPASMGSKGTMPMGHGFDVSGPGAASASASPSPAMQHGLGYVSAQQRAMGMAGLGLGAGAGQVYPQDLAHSQALLKHQQQVAQAYRAAGPGRPGQSPAYGAQHELHAMQFGALQPQGQMWAQGPKGIQQQQQQQQGGMLGHGPSAGRPALGNMGGPGSSPGSQGPSGPEPPRSPLFDPFAENPLLAAFSVTGGGAASVGQGPMSQGPASGSGRSPMSSPAVGHGGAPSSTAAHTASPPASSGFATPVLASPRAPAVEEPLSPSSLNSPFSAPAPDANHILSILSILEPEPTAPATTGSGAGGSGQAGNGRGRAASGSARGDGSASAASAAAAAEAVQRALGPSRSGGGTPPPTHGQGGASSGASGPAGATPNSDASYQQAQQLHASTGSAGSVGSGNNRPGGYGAASGSLLGSANSGASGQGGKGLLSEPTLHLLPGSGLAGLPQVHSGYNIWSTGAAGGGGYGSGAGGFAGAGQGAGSAAAAAAWGEPHAAPAYGSMDDATGMGSSVSAASPPPRGMDWPRAASMHDIAASLPSSLLPASLELDGPPAQQHNNAQHNSQQQRSQSLQQLPHSYLQGSGNSAMGAPGGGLYPGAYHGAGVGNAGAYGAAAQQQMARGGAAAVAAAAAAGAALASGTSGAYVQYMQQQQRAAAAGAGSQRGGGGGGAAQSGQLRSGAPSWPLAGAATSATAGKGVDAVQQQQAALLGAAAPGSPVAAGLGVAAQRYSMGTAGVGMGMGLFSGDGVNWGHAAGGRATNSTWAPFGGAPGLGGPQAGSGAQQQQQQQQQGGSGWPRSARQ